MFLILSLLAIPVQLMQYVYEFVSVAFMVASTPFLLLFDAIGKLI